MGSYTMSLTTVRVQMTNQIKSRVMTILVVGNVVL